jgi:sulfur transfer protein SufE
MAKIVFSEVTQKHARIIAYLSGSWLVALGLAYILNEPRLAGLAPILNYVAFAIKKELNKEGYIEALRK